MQFQKFSLGSLQTKCYLVWTEDSRQTLVIDPGDEGGFISQKILELELTPVGIILTHGHFDHVLGLLELKLNFKKTPILMHRADQFLLESLQSRAQYWLERQVDPAPPVDKFLTDGDQLKLGPEKLNVLHTPGHTPGSICLYDDEYLFSGDTLFQHGVPGRTDFSYSHPSQMRLSLKKVRQLAHSRILLPGH